MVLTAMGEGNRVVVRVTAAKAEAKATVVREAERVVAMVVVARVAEGEARAASREGKMAGEYCGSSRCNRSPA